ncbi:tetratricopeptide repeat protein [uncultured Tenacibaculum sp.]|uniref:tetratricopeptide repeat protein n=1 Tax=uncultured Tenacibaculum sp. TaxID=174713 RepID=UPI00262F1AEE|nr:tetratricopeptide repeat protein [uncultured Tenacibaculum sp.]
MKKYFLFILLTMSSLVWAQQNDFIIAENYFRNNEYNKALSLYKSLYDKSPFNTTYLRRLITCFQETEQYGAAENLLLTKLERQPKLTFLYVILGNTYERQQKKEAAEESYQKALKSLDKKNGYGSIVAGLFKNYTKLDYAIEAYEKVMANNPNANYGFQLAQIYGEKGDFNKMFVSYVDLVDKNKNYLNNVKRYTARYINDDAENENNVLFKKALLKKSISNPKDIWNDLLAWLFVRQKEYNKAFIQKKALLARDPDKLAAINDLGKIALENKDYETAEACFDLVIEKTNYPTDKFIAINYKLKIAIETKQSNIEERFQSVFNEYGISRNTFRTQIAYADYLTFHKGNPEKAIKVLEEAKKHANSKFTRATLKLKLGDVLVFTEKFNKALIYYSQVQTQFKNHFLAQQARFKVAQASYFKNDFKWAKAQLKVLKGSASQLIANDAADLFLTISDNEPKDSIPSGLKEYAKASLLAYQSKNNEAVALLKDVITNFKGQPIEDEALFKQAKIYIELKKYDEAILNYAKILEMDAEGILIDDVYYHMAELYNNELNDVEKAKEYYQKIIFDHPNSIYLVDARKKFRKLRGDNI